MSLDDIVNLTITADSKTPTRPGFGTLLCAVCDVPYTGSLCKEYTSLSEMTDDGWAATAPGYRMATKYWSQNPRPKKIKFGKRAAKHTKIVKLTMLTAVEGEIVSVDVAGSPFSYTIPAAATLTSVGAGLAALIVGTGYTVSNATGVITLTATVAGTLPNVANWNKNIALQDDTLSPAGFATDLANILVEDEDWYGLALDSNSKAEGVTAAAFVEANKKIMVHDTSDTGVLASLTTTDLASTLKASNYARSMVLFSGNELLSYASCAMMGNRFPFNPGSDTWAFKTLAGVPVSELSGSQVSVALGKNASVYTTVAGLAIVQYGKSASGEWMDVTRFIDWLSAEIKVRVFSLLANAQKVPFTDLGVDMIVSVIQGCLEDGVTAGGLDAGGKNGVPAPSVTAPLVSEVSSIDRGNRNLPDITFSARLAGAIHTMSINGTLAI